VGNLTNVVYAVSPALSFAYDANNRLTNMVDAVGTSGYSYDAAGQILAEDGPWSDDTVSYGYSSRLRNSLGILNPVAGAWAQTYAQDGAKRLTNVVSDAGTFALAYDSTRKLQVAKLSLPGGSFITNAFDSVARLTSTALKNSGLTVLNSHDYVYNAASQRTRQTRTDGSYADYTYDNDGELVTARGYESGGGTTRLNEQFGYAYDAAGNLGQRTNNALVQSFTVNSLNELTTGSRTGTLTVAGTTTTNATSVTVNGSAANRYGDATFALGGFTVTNGINAFTAIAQDALSRKDTNTVTVNLPSTPTYSYDANGNLLGDGNRILEYDDENQLTRVTVGIASKSEYTYDGRLRRWIAREYAWGAGGAASTAMVTNVTLSATVRNNHGGWLGTRIVVGASLLVVSDLGRWVRTGNTNAHTLKLVRSDGYDVPGASVSLNTSGATAGQFAYATLVAPVILEAGATYYLVSQETNGGDTWYDLDNTLVPTGAFALTGQVWAYNSTAVYTVYSATNKGYIPVNLKYTSGSWNLSKETRYLYDGMLAVQERDGNNVPTTTFTRGRDLSGTLSGAGGIGGLLARTAYDTGTGTHACYHADGNGNVTAMVNALQFVVAKYLYDPYGNTLAKAGPLAEANTLRFSSKEWCDGPGLYYYGYRFYDANLQRWVNRDPLGEEYDRNLYRFVFNDPINYIDPDGLSGTITINSSGDGGSSSTSGHSWICYTPDGGSPKTYGTWGNNPRGLGNGLHENLEQGRTGDASRSQHIDDDAEKRLMDKINDYKKKGENGWKFSKNPSENSRIPRDQGLRRSIIRIIAT